MGGRPREAGWVKGTSFGWAGFMTQGWSLVVRSLGVWLGRETGFRQRRLPFGAGLWARVGLRWKGWGYWKREELY